MILLLTLSLYVESIRFLIWSCTIFTAVLDLVFIVKRVLSGYIWKLVCTVKPGSTFWTRQCDCFSPELYSSLKQT